MQMISSPCYFILGRNFVKAGWTASGNTIKVKLDGASAYDARDIVVMVCPYLG